MKTKFSGILTLFLAFVVQLTFAQEKTISGTISDENGLPLPGVNIIVQGTTTGTQSDFDGNYSITASLGSVLEYSYIGYTTKQMTVGESDTISFAMELDSEALTEVVITALGIKRKQDEITTANQVVKTEEITKAGNPNVIQSLAGKVSGLVINQNSNGVAATQSITLRGNRSISGDNSALIIIDGAISTANFLNSLDPNIVESVNVIKGANGAALYGSQGSNGAIIVTTKKGEKGDKLAITYRSSIDFENVAYVPERQTRYGQGWDLGDGFTNIPYENGGWGPEFDGQMVPVGLAQADGSYIMAPFASRGSDHIKEFFETGTTFQNGLTISNNSDSGYIFASVQRQDTDFVIKNDQITRNSFNFKAGKTINKWTLSGNVTYVNTSRERTLGGIYEDLLQTPSNVPIKAFEFSGNEGHWNAYFENPFWIRDNDREERDNDRFNILGELKYDINDNINVLLRSNGNFNTASTLRYVNAYTEPEEIISNTGADRTQTSSFRYYTTTFKAYDTNLLFNFDYELSSDFTLKANLGANAQYQKSTYVGVGGQDLTIPGLYTGTNLNGEFTGDPTTGDDRSKTTRLGVYAQADLGFRDYLFLNVTGRNDWSSVLAKQNNSFFYPSVGLAFIATKAIPSIKNDVLNYAKLSASYVKVGNDGGIGAYGINPVFNQAGGFPLGGQNSFVRDLNITDPLLEPEFTTTLEAGANLGFFNNRITLDGAYYQFSTDNQITQITASAASGLSTASINLGETEGWGYEVDLGVGIIDNKNNGMSWDVNIGYVRTENKVVKVSDQASQVALTTGGTTQVYAVEGQAYPLLQGTAYLRDDQGRVVINSSNGLPEQVALKQLGRTSPPHVVNLRTSFSFKGFTLAATMDYRTGHYFYSSSKENLTWSGHLIESAQTGRGAFIFPNSSIQTSPGVFVANTTVPSGGTSAGDYINFWNTMRGIGENQVLDATAFKVRELSLRYDLSPDFIKPTGLSSVSVSLIGRNLFTVLPKENRGYSDPEASFATGNAQGIQTLGQYPPTRSLGFALNITL
ncbi:SusC/RagA family TonB-linked outer membrane protein [Bizionia sediminis]|uniref:SusC/RagA family TonB-linked outer membrane protein n=1 Tax=Bizionia sediminis TaxID=1737064 RepID=A0ABW5KTV8_9FLAO